MLQEKDGDLFLINKYGTYSRNELQHQLLTSKLTVKELGQVYDLNHSRMNHVLRLLGINERNYIGDTRIPDSTIDPSLHQVFIGTLMGDAYMTHPRCYQVAHSIKQCDYLYHIAGRIHKFVSSLSRGSCPLGESISLWTYRHVAFKPYFEQFYSRGKKKKYFHDRTAHDLEAEGLAYWFMDDGGYNKHGNYFSLGNVSREEGAVLVNLLKYKFRIDCWLQKHGQNYFNLYIGASGKGLFRDIVSPYLIPHMRYKIGSPKMHPSSIVNLHADLCKVAGRKVRLNGDPEKYSYKKGTIEELVKSPKISGTAFKRKPSKDEIIKLLGEGYTDGDIAQRYRISRNTIGVIRRSCGIEKQSSRLAPDMENKLTDLFKVPDMSILGAMKTTGLTFYKVKRWLQRR